MGKITAVHFIIVVLISLLFRPSHLVFASGGRRDSYTPGNYGEGSLKPYQCGGRCSTRCDNTSYRKACMTYCQKCCSKCLCVPPGYYGHKELCPCYNNWKTKSGGPKCP